MPYFKIVPTGHPENTVEIASGDRESVFRVTSGMACREADVWEDGRYRFSLRKCGRQASFWAIFQRPPARKIL